MSQRRSFTPTEIAFLLGIPLAWAVLLLFHPTGEGEAITYADVQDQVTPWLVVHLGMMLFIPLFAVAMYLLLRDIEGTAARVSRIALVPFVVFYGAYEVLLGIGAGILVHDVNGFAPSERAAGASLVNEFTDNVLIRGFSVLSSIGAVAFITATIAAGVALRRHAAAPLAVPILLGLSGFLITAHPPPFGPTGLVLFIAAVLLSVRGQAPARAPAPRTQPAFRVEMDRLTTHSAPDSVSVRRWRGKGRSLASIAQCLRSASPRAPS